MSVIEKVLDVIAKELRCSPDLLSVNSGLGLTEGWDSLAHSQIVLAIEENMDVAFDFDEFDRITCVQAIIESINLKDKHR